MSIFQIQFAYKSDPTQPELWTTVAITESTALADVGKHAMDVIKAVLDGCKKTTAPSVASIATRLIGGPGTAPPIPIDSPAQQHTVEWDESSNDPALGGKRVVGVLYQGFTMLEAKMAADVAVNFESYYVLFAPKQPMPPSPHHGWDSVLVKAEDFTQAAIGVSSPAAVLR